VPGPQIYLQGKFTWKTNSFLFPQNEGLQLYEPIENVPALSSLAFSQCLQTGSSEKLERADLWQVGEVRSVLVGAGTRSLEEALIKLALRIESPILQGPGIEMIVSRTYVLQRKPHRLA
jgi:hypothetical protein